jgi:GDP-6-deoxy-D-talose 4-dehydrogenase
MKILVTGAAGFTGRFFRAAAQNAGHDVIALEGDLTDKTAVAAQVAVVQPDAVVHLAAISFVAHADDNAFYAVNVVGTTHLLAALATVQKPLTRVLLASSANVYGNCEASPINEQQPPAPVNHYAVSKLAMEYMARTYLDRLPIVLTRPFNYTGPGQSLNFVIPKLVDHYVRRASVVELGNLHVEREFNDVRTVCDAYLALLEHGRTGEVYNVCSGQPYTLRQVMDTLAELTSHTVQAKVNPAFVRANEVHRLCGAPTKLQNLVSQSNVALCQPGLRETLRWMLAEAQH